MSPLTLNESLPKPFERLHHRFGMPAHPVPAPHDYGDLPGIGPVPADCVEALDDVFHRLGTGDDHDLADRPPEFPFSTLPGIGLCLVERVDELDSVLQFPVHERGLPCVPVEQVDARRVVCAAEVAIDLFSEVRAERGKEPDKPASIQYIVS